MRAQDASATKGEGSPADSCSEPTGDDNNQMHARENASAEGQGDRPEVELAFWVPDSIAELAEEAMLAVRQGSEPRWRAFERMVALVILEWLSVPRHRDPIFERDGFRCSVPGCTSRCHLHDHHLRFRSQGGGDEAANRTTVCVAHHHQGIHAGNIHARGSAPDGIAWELGCRPGHEPLTRSLGDHILTRSDEGQGLHDPVASARDEDPASCDQHPGPHDPEFSCGDDGPVPHDPEFTRGDDGPVPHDLDPGALEDRSVLPDQHPVPADSELASGEDSPGSLKSELTSHDGGPALHHPQPVPRSLDPANPSPQPA